MPRGNFRKPVSEVNEEAVAAPQTLGDSILKSVEARVEKTIELEMKTFVTKVGDEAIASLTDKVRAKCDELSEAMTSQLKRRYEYTIEGNSLIIKIRLG